MTDQPPAASGDSPTDNAKGTLVIIGGHEDRRDERVILREFARLLKGGRRVILSTVASHEPKGYFDDYRRAFDDLGVRDLTELYIGDRAEARDEDTLRDLEKADGVFFSGGDQLRIHRQIGGTPVEKLVREIHRRGGVVAGTSAGAAAMGDLMLVDGASGESNRIGDVSMEPGLGLLHGAIVDQHFAQRGRIGRLLGALAMHPEMLGIGIDEDTAIVVSGDSFRVVGSGAVYVVDGQGVTGTNLESDRKDRMLSMVDVRLHVLSHGERFDLAARRPSAVPDVRESHDAELKAQGLDPAGSADDAGAPGGLSEAAKALRAVDGQDPAARQDREDGRSGRQERAMQASKRIALVAHDAKKDELLEWVRHNEKTLAAHRLWSTGTTGAAITEACPKLDVTALKSGPLGGDQQIGARIAEGDIDVLVFFIDPLAAQPHEADVQGLVRLSTLYNVALATNRTSADFLITSPLFTQDFAPAGTGEGKA